MARSLNPLRPNPRCRRVVSRSLALGLCLAVCTATIPLGSTPTEAAELDRKGRSDAKTALRFYKQGNYEDAAKIFLRLSIDYPDMLVFVRNLGACYYYMRRYEPALSNLRDYEHRKKDISPDDRVEVAGWIGEMERLRDQAAATATPPDAAVASPASPVPALAPLSAPSVATVSSGENPSATVPVPDQSSVAQTLSETATPAPGQSPENAASQPVPPVARPPSAYQPAYPPEPHGVQPQPVYPQGPYAAQPAYPYPPPRGAYATGAYHPAGVATPVRPPRTRGGGRRAAAWILGLAGVGGILAGGLFTALTLDRFSKVQKKYDPALEKEGKRFAMYQWICYGSGAALLTAAIVVGAGGDSPNPGLALSPTVGPGLTGASLSGSF